MGNRKRGGAPTRKQLVIALVAALKAAQTAAKESGDSKAASTFEGLWQAANKWVSAPDLASTIAAGSELQGELGALLGRAVAAVKDADIPKITRDAVEKATSDVEDQLDEAPSGEPPAPPPMPVPTNPSFLGTEYSGEFIVADKHVDRSTGKTITILERPSSRNPNYLVQEEGDPKPFRVSADDLQIHYEPKPWEPVGGRRKTRRGKRKVRRVTKKRRAKSLRRR